MPRAYSTDHRCHTDGFFRVVPSPWHVCILQGEAMGWAVMERMRGRVRRGGVRCGAVNCCGVRPSTVWRCVVLTCRQEEGGKLSRYHDYLYY